MKFTAPEHNNKKNAENIKFIQNLKINECKKIIHERIIYKIYTKKEKKNSETIFRQHILGNLSLFKI